MAYSVRGRVLAGAALALLGSVVAGGCGSSGHGGGLGAGGSSGTTSTAPIDCARNSDCPGALLCDRALKVCVDCLKDLDCTDGAACLGGTCHAACQSDKDCRTTDQLCNDAGVCVDCITDVHCLRGEVCNAAGVCEKPAADDGGAPGSVGSQNTAGESVGSAGDASSVGAAPNGDAGMPGSDGGSPTIGGNCVMAPIDPCAGLPHYNGTQTVDGDPSDFCDIAPFELALAGAPYYRPPAAPLTSTTKASFRVGWSATALHIFIDVTDNSIHPNASNSLINLWDGDNIEFYASPKAPLGLFNYARSYESGAFQVIAAPPGPVPPAGEAAFTSTGYASPLPPAQYKMTLTAKGYSMEAEIPWTTVAPTAGMPMGFDAGLSDDVDGLYASTTSGLEYRDYYALLYNANYVGYCSLHTEPYCDSRNWCAPTALP